MIIALLLKHKMHMARPIRMPVQLLQQLAHRPIMRNRIGHRFYCLEPEVSLRISAHHAPSIGPFAISVLHVVVARRVCFPDINLDVFNGPALCIAHRACNEKRFAGGILGDAFSLIQRRCFVRVKGAQDCAFGGVCWFGMVDRVHEQRETEHV